MTVENQFIRRKIAFKRRLLQLEFLKKCRNYKIIPKFLQIKRGPSYSDKFEDIYFNAELKLLKAYIKEVRKELARTEVELYYMHLELAFSMPHIVFNNTMDHIQYVMDRELPKIRNTHDKKFNLLLKRRDGNETSRFPIEDNFINLTDYVPSMEEKFILNKGPKYCPKLSLNIDNTICDLEKCIKKMPSELQSSMRGFMAWQVEKSRRKTKTEIKDRNNNNMLNANLYRKIQNNVNFRVMCADKATKFVLISNEQYLSKVEKTLQELNVTEIKKDPTDKFIRKLRDLKNNFPEHRKFFEQLPIYSTTPPLFFKVKTHKEDNPLRPIVNRKKSPLYFLEKYVSKMLDPLIEGHEYTIKSSGDFIDAIKQVKLNTTAKFYSFDVKALYPSIPMKEVMKIILEKYEGHPVLSKDKHFMEAALNLINQSNCFTVNQKIYQQNKGAPMGSPISAKLGELIMQFIENKVIKNRSLKPHLYKRYVDDTFVIWDYTEKELYKLVEEINEVFQSIQLTVEKEKNRSLAFLDVLVHRTEKNEEIWTEVFHKRTAPLEIIPADSVTYRPYVNNAIIPLIKRAYTHCTYKVSEDKELNLIKKVMHKQGYKRKCLDKLERQAKKPKNGDKKLNFIGSVQYHPSLNEIRKVVKAAGYMIAFKSTNLRNIVVADRDRTKPIGGIYKIPIKFKNEILCYIGKTRNNINKRIYKHKYGLDSDYENTALKDFLLKNPAEPLWEKTVILKSPRDDKALEIMEKLQIWRHRGACVNKVRDKYLELLWQPLLRTRLK